MIYPSILLTNDLRVSLHAVDIYYQDLRLTPTPPPLPQNEIIQFNY